MKNRILRKCRFIFLMFLLCCSFMTSSAYAKEKNMVEGDAVAEFVNQEIDTLVSQGLAKGITVSVVKDGKSILCKGYGYADEKNRIQVDPEQSTFMIGSVSKVFVPIAALQLAEQGRLDLDAPISEYLGLDFPKLKYPVTMKQLLTHTAGFDFMLSNLEVETEKDQMKLKDFLLQCRPEQVYQPGEVSDYSNYGIALAGYVIECITGQSYAEYAQEHIFNPLGMNLTTYQNQPKGVLSKAYSPMGEEKKDVLLNSYPAGSVTSTAMDMAVFMNFLLMEGNQDILPEKAKNDLFAKHFCMEEDLPGMGYVWMRHEVNGHSYYSHNGGTANFSSELVLYPEQRIGIFLCSNQTNSGRFSLADCIYGVTELLYGKETEQNIPVGSEKAGSDISGYYDAADRIILGSDKLLNVLYYGFTKKVTGNPAEGYRMSGDPLQYLGNHRYLGKAGEYTFIQKGDRLYYTLNGSNSFLIRVPWYESSQLQLLILGPVLLVLVLGFLIFSLRLVVGIYKKKEKYDTLGCIPPVAVVLALAVIIARFMSHMNYMNTVFGGLNCTVGIAGVILFIRIAAVVITLLGLAGIAAGIYYWKSSRSLVLRLFYTVWNIAVLFFELWLIQMNLLF